MRVLLQQYFGPVKVAVDLDIPGYVGVGSVGYVHLTREFPGLIFFGLATTWLACSLNKAGYTFA